MKKNLFFFLIIFLFFFAACNKKQLQKKSANLVSIDKMAAIVSDILLIENTINLISEDSNKIRMLNTYYNYLFKHYNITKEQFQKNIDYYLSNEDDAEKMFNVVKIELKNIEKEYFGDDEANNDENITIAS